MRLAVVVNNLGATQFNFDLIRSANQHLADHPADDLVVFFESVAKVCLPCGFAAMQILHAYSYAGPVVATNLSTAEKVLRLPTATEKLFWIQDLEWASFRMTKSFDELLHVYTNPQLTLIARSVDHAKIIRDMWGRTPLVVEPNNVVGLLEAMNQ